MKKYDSVLKRVRIVEEKNGIKYAKTEGKLYKALRVLYSIIGLYSFGINLLFILGMVLVNSGTDNFSSVANSLITVSVCTALIIAGYVLSFFKFKLVAGIISFVPQIFLIVSFGAVMKDDLGFYGFKPSFYWRHLIPLLLMAVLIIWTTIIAVRERVKTEKQYKKILNGLYSQYLSGSGSGDLNSITDEQWDEFLENFDPNDYKKLFKAKEQPEEGTEIKEKLD